jgi:hypothetical protein
MTLIISCGKTEDNEQTYTTYNVEYLLQNNIDKGKRFTITYKHPAYANKTTESYENVEDTLWIRFEAKSLDYLYLAGTTYNDTTDYRISIFVDSKLVKSDSTSCNWQCESTFIEVEYPLP